MADKVACMENPLTTRRIHSADELAGMNLMRKCGQHGEPWEWGQNLSKISGILGLLEESNTSPVH
jgi:hypothetical protein